jgi:hypothetical protein
MENMLGKRNLEQCLEGTGTRDRSCPDPSRSRNSMANIGEIVKPGYPAPEAGTYQCNAVGCTNTFKASIKGVPLPPAHHPGAAWKLTEKTTAAPEAPKLAAKPAQPGTPKAQPAKGAQPGPKAAPGSPSSP